MPQKPTRVKFKKRMLAPTTLGACPCLPHACPMLAPCLPHAPTLPCPPHACPGLSPCSSSCVKNMLASTNQDACPCVPHACPMLAPRSPHIPPFPKPHEKSLPRKVRRDKSRRDNPDEMILMRMSVRQEDSDFHIVFVLIEHNDG